ncbi:MAG: B12-binding domain-containing radical SAM protein [Clostridiales Family XIII bacterium]|jgi:radical SAM superfamily enzyme YgiQ (UPF0313 family)|nr:B12-binding domain-containing radical SAM protein [Clostridiales Family XIII bacterium]
MKILLIQPKMNKRPMDTDLKTRLSPPLALLVLAGLTPAGHEIAIANENTENADFGADADLVGITVTLDAMPRARRIAEIFRRRGIPVVAGGVHVTCCPEDCASHFDAICIGPAERVWARIVADAESGCLKREYFDMEGFRGEEIASPQYDGIDKRKYLYTNVVTTSRGCPNRCAFCYNSCRNRRHVLRPVPEVLRDIEALGTRHVLFIDDNFIGSPAHTRALLSEISGMNLIWGAAVTTRILNEPELLDLMAKSGCKSLFIGFESVNPASLADVGKDNREELYERLADAIHSRGMMVNASMVFGLDGDDAGTFKRTLDRLVKMRVETLTSHILTPYPGTELYRRLESAGRITETDLAKYNTAHVVFKPAGMTAEELRDGYLRMYRKFYSLRNIIRRFPKEKSLRMPYLLFNLLYRKYGRATSALARFIPLRSLGKLAARLSYKL